MTEKMVENICLAVVGVALFAAIAYIVVRVK